MGDESLEKRVSELSTLIHGSPGDFGMKTKVDIMWRVHALPLLMIGAAIGALATMLVKNIAG